MKLSVCMIVRNEEARLGDAIASVRALRSECGLAIELVVTDTGSTDGTIALAEKLGARVTRFVWCDDFAAARNACAAAARGEWLLWLDADERVKAGSGLALRSELADLRMIAYHVVREDNFVAGRSDWYSEMYQMRLVRRDLPTRFVGRIHEHLDPAPVELAKTLRRGVAVSRVRLQHWGYTNDQLPGKLRRAAHLCELELRERPRQMYYMVELARSLLMLGTREETARGLEVLGEAAGMLMERRGEAEAPSPMAASLIEQLLAIPGQRWVPIEDLLDLSARWFPKSAPLVWAAARTYSMQGEWERAEALLRRVIEMAETGSHDKYMSFDPRVAEDARFNFGVALVRLARLDEAEAVFTALLSSPRRGADARANLGAIAQVRASIGG